MSKGGSTTSSTEIPAWLENAAIENINKGRAVSEIGYTPYYGPEVAAFSPMQQQSMQSTGNAASAFGLAPQGFDAMAGMPEAQTFAGGIQGYSSAPLYEESLAQLQQNRPAQYDAINSMFIDPFTGARPTGDYAASPEQVEDMFSNGSQFETLPVSPPSSGGGSTGEYYGVNDQYNPYKYSTPTEDISGDGVVDYRDMSFGEAGRRDIGWGEKAGDLLSNITGISAIGKAADYAEGLADGFTPSPSNGLLTQTSGAMDSADARNNMNAGADRYEARLAQERLAEQYGLYGAGQNFSEATPEPPTLAEQYALYGAGQGFSEATTPAAQVEPVATTRPYPASNITAGPNTGYDLMSSVVPAKAPISVDAMYDLQTALRDEELYNQGTSVAKQFAEQQAIDKTRADKVKAEKAKAYAAAVKKREAKEAAVKKANAREAAVAEIERRLAEEEAEKRKKAAERLAAARAGAIEDARIEAETKRTAERIAKETAKSNAAAAAKRKAAKAQAKAVAAAKAKRDMQAKIAAAQAAAAAAAAAKKKRDRPPEKAWSPPKNNGYTGKAKTGYRFGL